MIANHRQERRGTTDASVPSLSPLELLPTKILREIVASDLETSRAVVRSRGGCLRLELNPSILQTSKTMLSKCRESLRGNRLVRVTYKGDACFRPTVDAYKILAAPYELVRVAFVADLNVAHKVLSSNDNFYIATVNVCVITVDAACTWLAILSCLQLAEHMYAEEPPSFQLDLLVHKKDIISSRVCSNLYQAIALMLDGSTALNAIRTPRESGQLGSLPKNIWSSLRDAVVLGGSVYGAWISSSTAHGPAISALRPHDARLDHCTYICKILIGLQSLTGWLCHDEDFETFRAITCRPTSLCSASELDLRISSQHPRRRVTREAQRKLANSGRGYLHDRGLPMSALDLS